MQNKSSKGWPGLAGAVRGLCSAVRALIPADSQQRALCTRQVIPGWHLMLPWHGRALGNSRRNAGQKELKKKDGSGPIEGEGGSGGSVSDREATAGQQDSRTPQDSAKERRRAITRDP